jgi:hypothetical protein
VPCSVLLDAIQLRRVSAGQGGDDVPGDLSRDGCRNQPAASRADRKKIDVSGGIICLFSYRRMRGDRYTKTSPRRHNAGQNVRLGPIKRGEDDEQGVDFDRSEASAWVR